MPKRALITGITGQDGSYLADLLLEKGYEVHGTVRRSSTIQRSRIDHLMGFKDCEDPRLFLHYADLSDSFSIAKLMYEIRPDEIYNLACQSHVKVSFEMPAYTADIIGLGLARILEGIVEAKLIGQTRIFQASSSEMFGLPPVSPQVEDTPFHPRSPYGCAKAFAHWLLSNFRESYGLFAVSGIMYNHESPRRAENFVTRKISKAVAEIKKGKRQKLELGNLDARRDWGYAKEYVEGMWLSLQAEEPADYIFATNTEHSIKDFLAAAFERVDLDWRDYVQFDKRLLRPLESVQLRGDYTKAKDRLGWQPTTIMPQLAHLMVDADLAALG